MTTLKTASISKQTALKRRKKSIARTLLGKYKGILPRDQSSTAFLKEGRRNLYGKIK